MQYERIIPVIDPHAVYNPLQQPRCKPQIQGDDFKLRTK